MSQIKWLAASGIASSIFKGRRRGHHDTLENQGRHLHVLAAAAGTSVRLN
jgi:hypothetical protein